MCYHLHIRPGPCVGELVHIYISCCESLQGQLSLSVIIHDGLFLDEVGKRGFQLCREGCTHSKKQSFKECFLLFLCKPNSTQTRKINGLDPFHPFRFQTDNMHADNTILFPGRRLEARERYYFMSNKQDLMFLFQQCRFGLHSFRKVVTDQLGGLTPVQKYQ